MPKSRTRKGHRKAVASFRKRVEDRKKSFEKQMRMLYEKQQQDALDNQIKGEVQSVESDGAGIDVSDFNMGEDMKIPELIPQVVEGVTKSSEEK